MLDGAKATDQVSSELDRRVDALIDGGSGHESQVTQLVALAKANGVLAYSDEDTGIIITRLARGTGRRCYRVPSSQFETWLRGLYYDKTGRGVAQATLRDATATVLAACRHDGERVEVHIRVAKAADAYWIDMGDDLGRAIRVDANGWSIVDNPPVLFLRPRDAHPLPEPTPCAPEDMSEILDEHLLAHLNVAAEDQLLLLACIIEMMRPDTPYVVIDLDGVQGSAKSTTQRRIRSLVDPHEVLLRGRPKSVEDIWVAAYNGYVVSYENLSSLSAEQQDALCALSTGAGHAGRTLYANSEESTIRAKRPIIINGIGSAATRPDLIDRTVHFELAEINDADRRTEVEMEAAWKESYPRGFGAILTLFSMALKLLPQVKLDAKPRMADFALLGCAVAKALGHDQEQFLARYQGNRREGAQRALDAYPAGHAIITLVMKKSKGETITLTMQALYDTVIQALPDREGAPRSARGLSALLKKIAPALRLHGVIVERGGHTEQGNMVTLRRA
jgi:hypothetical protein